MLKESYRTAAPHCIAIIVSKTFNAAAAASISDIAEIAAATFCKWDFRPLPCIFHSGGLTNYSLRT